MKATGNNSTVFNMSCPVTDNKEKESYKNDDRLCPEDT